MHKLIVLLCILTSALGSTLELLEKRKLRRKEPTSLFDNERIVGGVETDIREVPYQVGMVFQKFTYCGGSLITETHVLTAAHCLRTPADYISIHVGSSKSREGGTLIPASRTLRHPKHKFSPKHFDYDVGIVALARKAPLSDTVKIIQVPEKEASANTIFRVAGWGKTTEGGIEPEVLRSIYIPAISRSKCQEMYANTHNVTNRMICAYDPGKGSCQGDSGGAVVADGKVYGIVSWGVGCARPGYPGVYTNVADNEIRAFIRENANI